MLPLQRLGAGVLRHHVGGDEDVLGADQRRVDEDVGDGRRGRRGWQKYKKSDGFVGSHFVSFTLFYVFCNSFYLIPILSKTLLKMLIR